MLKLVLSLAATAAALSAHTVIYLHDVSMPVLQFPQDVTVRQIEYRTLYDSLEEIIDAFFLGNADVVAQGRSKKACVLADEHRYELRQCVAVDSWTPSEAQEKLSGWSLYQVHLAWFKTVRYAWWKYYDLQLAVNQVFLPARPR